ncbi:MAG: hypothetical protein ACM3NJ_00135 [Methanobacterium sp.]
MEILNNVSEVTEMKKEWQKPELISLSVNKDTSAAYGYNVDGVMGSIPS